jgi:hypothetical protein
MEQVIHSAGQEISQIYGAQGLTEKPATGPFPEPVESSPREKHENVALVSIDFLEPFENW